MRYVAPEKTTKDKKQQKKSKGSEQIQRHKSAFYLYGSTVKCFNHEVIFG